jgi:plasmid stabilization system protein ParE
LPGTTWSDNPSAARRAAKRIKSATASLREHPLLGHPVLTPEGDEREEIRDLIVPFGARAYRIRYQVLPDEVRGLRVWHAREDVDETSR